MAEMTAVRITRERLALGVLLAGTGVLYLWNLPINGWANSFYAAAVQAGSQDATAWLFGSSDPANAITVDKTPAALWVMDYVVQSVILGMERLYFHQGTIGACQSSVFFHFPVLVLSMCGKSKLTMNLHIRPILLVGSLRHGRSLLRRLLCNAGPSRR